MSAMFAGKSIIDLIVSGAIEMGLIAHLPPANGPVLITAENAIDFGRMLWTENRRALVTRYAGRCDPDGMAEQIAGYELRRFIGVKPAGLYAVARFLDYQCDEDSSYARSNACLALRTIIGGVLTAHNAEAILSEAAELPYAPRTASDIAAYLDYGTPF